MLIRQFDPRNAYRVVLYLRMSSDQQNDRSPEQQEAEIRRRLAFLGLSWQIVATYRDDAISGRYQRKRPGYQQLLSDIRSGRLQVDLIVVDTFERFGRHDDLDAVRKDLRKRHGVLVVTADSNFADPDTPQGRALGAFEALRATEEGRIKAHQVLRGKRDLAERGFWPGGSPPFGYRLVSVMTHKNGREVPEGSRLAPNEEEAWIVRLTFDRANATGEGPTRLAKFLNAHSDIPDRYKPFHAPTIGDWLDSPIYRGDLRWNELATDIHDDVRRVERKPAEEHVLVPGFCPPLVEPDVWEAVQSVRQARRQSREAKSEATKLIAPLVPGATLKYPLSGLVRCAHCGSSMRPVTSGSRSKAGASYVYYACPRGIEGSCDNTRHIPETWLRQVVVDRIRQALFLPPPPA